MSLISPELVIIVWHDLGDIIYGQMKETVKGFQTNFFLQDFYNKFFLTFIISFLFFSEVVEARKAF